MGSGKTTVGKLLAEKLNFTFLDLDDFIEKKYNKTIAQIFAENGENGFREMENLCLHEVAGFKDIVISTGGGTPCFFDNIDFINKNGYSVYLKVKPEELAIRLKSGLNGVRPLIAGLNDEELLEYITDNIIKREPFYNKSQFITQGSLNEVMLQIVSFLMNKEN